LPKKEKGDLSFSLGLVLPGQKEKKGGKKNQKVKGGRGVTFRKEGAASQKVPYPVFRDRVRGLSNNTKEKHGQGEPWRGVTISHNLQFATMEKRDYPASHYAGKKGGFSFLRRESFLRTKKTNRISRKHKRGNKNRSHVVIGGERFQRCWKGEDH